MISEYTGWLRSVTNKQGRPFQEGTITDYAEPHPYTDGLHRYSPVQTRPSTLDQEFIQDLLRVTGGGQARDFTGTRDHAIIRMLTEGVRRTELIQQHTGDLPADLIAHPFVRIVPLKGARAAGEGRIVPLSPSASRAGRHRLPARLVEPLHARPLWRRPRRAPRHPGQAAARGDVLMAALDLLRNGLPAGSGGPDQEPREGPPGLAPPQNPAASGGGLVGPNLTARRPVRSWPLVLLALPACADQPLLHAGHTEFRTGWFVESIATQTLVIYVIRTRRVPFFKSRPSVPMRGAIPLRAGSAGQ